MYDVHVNFVRSKDAQKELARMSLIVEKDISDEYI